MSAPRPLVGLSATQPLGAVRLSVDCATACRVRSTLTAARSLATVLGKANRVIGRRTVRLAAGEAVVRLPVTARALKRLRRADVGRARAVLSLVVTDAAGNVTRSARTVRVAIAP